MIGGHFNYEQCRIGDIAETLDRDIGRALNATPDDDFMNFKPETIAAMREGRKALSMASFYVRRLDLLLSGDVSEESFLFNLEKDLDVLKTLEPTRTADEYNVDELFERGEVHAYVDDRNGIWIHVHGDDDRPVEDVKLGVRVTSRGPMTVKPVGGGRTVIRIFDFPADGPKR